MQRNLVRITAYAVVLLTHNVWAERLPAQDRQDNALTQQEKDAGWLLLFDGTLEGWTTNTGAASNTPVQDGALNPHGSGGYMLIHKRDWSDFRLALEFKISPGCNSGVFIRTFPLMPRPGKDVGFNGIEVAIDDTMTSGLHDTGAIYDLSAPSANLMTPAGSWNAMEILCQGPVLEIEINGKLVNKLDLDTFTVPNKRPDGTEHKFDVAYKDHPRHGYIGLQDHGSDIWYKNIKLLPLAAAPAGE